MKLIKNDVVKMDWDADCFFESKKKGFIGAVKVYETETAGSVPVCFADGCAFVLLDNESESVVLNAEAVNDCIKASYKAKVPMAEYCEDIYGKIGDLQVVDAEVAAYYGLSEEDCYDIDARINDLSGYWITVEEDMA